MALCKRGEYWWFNFRFKGKKIQGPTKVKSKTVAREIEAAYRVKLAKGEVGLEEKEPAPPFRQAMKDFLAWSKQEHAARPNTYRRYQISSLALLKFFKDTSLDKITSDNVEKYKTARSKQKGIRTEKKLKPATVNRELACLKALFNRNRQSVPVNPVREVKYLNEESDQLTVLTVEEQEKYLLTASQPLRDIATLMLETGMRPEEVYRIKKENVHLEQGYIYNPYGKTKAAKRKVPLSDTAIHILERRVLCAKGGTYLFCGRKTGEVKRISQSSKSTILTTRP